MAENWNNLEFYGPEKRGTCMLIFKNTETHLNEI